MKRRRGGNNVDNVDNHDGGGGDEKKLIRQILKQIADNTRSKSGFQLVVSGTGSRIVTTYDPPIKLNPKRQYEIALLDLETYYSFPNIDKTNNMLRFRKNDKDAWKMIEIPVGSYEIIAINNEIQRQVESKDVTLVANLNTLRCMLCIKGTYEVDFNVDNSLRTVLGFDAKTYKGGRHSSEHSVNIMRINSILVHTDIITSTYRKGKMEPIIYSFFPNVSPGEKIRVIQENLTYAPVTTDTIYRMTAWLTDQDSNELNLRGELLTIRFHLREC